MSYVADIGRSVMGGLSARSEARAAADTAGRNAANARASARQTRLEGAQAEEAQRREARRALGAAFTAMAQNGGGFDELLFGDMARESELDAMTIGYNTEMDARGFDAEANQFDADQRNYKRAAKAAVQGAVVGSALGALRGVSDYRTQKANKRLLEARRGAKTMQNTRIKTRKTGSPTGYAKPAGARWQDNGLNWSGKAGK